MKSIKAKSAKNVISGSWSAIILSLLLITGMILLKLLLDWITN